MPYLKLDWHACFTDALPALQSCDTAARRAFVTTTSNSVLPPAAFEPEDVETLTRVGLTEVRPAKKDLVRTLTGRRLAHLLRLAYIPPSRTHAAAPDPRQQLLSVLGAGPAHTLIGQEAPTYGWGNTQTRDGWSRLTVPEWPAKLVAAKTAKAAKAFEAKHYAPVAHGTGGDHGPYYGDAKVRGAARKILEHLLDQPDKVTPADLVHAFADLPADTFSRAFESLARYAMVFFWTGPRPEWLREDLNAVLIAAAEAPLRLKSNDNSFYAADLKRLEAALAPVDDPLRTAFEQQLGGLTETFGRYTHPADFDERLHTAVVMANHLELLDSHEPRKGPYQMVTAEEGRAWLGETVAQQTRRLIAAVGPHLMQPGLLGHGWGYRSLNEPRGPEAARLFLNEDPGDALRAAGEVFHHPGRRKSDPPRWLPAAPAVRHAARHCNPLPDAIAGANNRKRKSGRDWERKRAWEALKDADDLNLESSWTGPARRRGSRRPHRRGHRAAQLRRGLPRPRAPGPGRGGRLRRAHRPARGRGHAVQNHQKIRRQRRRQRPRRSADHARLTRHHRQARARQRAPRDHPLGQCRPPRQHPLRHPHRSPRRRHRPPRQRRAGQKSRASRRHHARADHQDPKQRDARAVEEGRVVRGLNLGDSNLKHQTIVSRGGAESAGKGRVRSERLRPGFPLRGLRASA